MAAAGADGFSTGAEGAYFLVLDRLRDALDGRLEVWKELERRKKANLSPEFELHLKALFVKQIQVGMDLASALAHLHKLRIIFRDLKVCHPILQCRVSQRPMAKQIVKLLHQELETFCKEHSIRAIQRSRRGTM